MKITTLKSVFKSFFLALILLVFHIEFSSAQNGSKKSVQNHNQGSNNRLLGPIQITGNFSICLPGPSTTQLTGSGGSGIPHPTTPWLSSNPAVATIDNTGLVTQVAFGTTTITYYDNGGNQTSQNVYVSTYPTVSGTTASPNACAGGGQTTLTGSLFPHPTTPWTSADTSIATVDNNGLVTGVAAGTVNITYMNLGGCTTSIPVTIKPLLSPSISCGVPTYNSVTFNWPAVTGAATYTVVYSINAGPYAFGTSGNITSWTKPGLNPGDSVTVFITPSGAAGNCFTGAFHTCVALSCDAFSTPTAPVIGTITQPSCATATGSVQLTGLPAGAWTINPGNISGSGATYTVTGLATGSYTFTVKNSFGCTSVASASATINAQPPTPATPNIGTITQTTCASATGSVQLSGLPAGSWTINPGAIAGSGATYTVNGLAAGTYNFTVTNSVGCPSAASASATINAQPPTPAAPTIGTITQTTCASATGSIELTGLPTGAWTINPGAIAGSGATYTVNGLAAGSYSYTVTNAVGCTSVASVSTTINTQPTTPAAPTIGTITQTTCASATGSVQLTGLPTGTWTINPGAISGSGATYTVSGLAAGTYNFTVTNASSCTSTASTSATINAQPPTPAAPIIGTITQTTCASATGSVQLTGLPAGTWTINPGAIAGSGLTYTISGLAAGTYNFTVTNSVGCPSTASASATINTQPATPTAPTIGTITQTTCASATGSVQLTGLPAGAWTINPGAIAGTGATYTVNGLAAGTYNFTVTNASSCTSVASASATINTQPVTPAAPTIGTITQTTCASATGSIQLTGLPTGAWTINPGAIAGTGATYTVTGLAAGTYNFTVTNAVGCPSTASASATINTQPVTPAAPTIGTITQTTCASATGSVQLTGLPAGAWTINPGAIAGSGATYTVTGLIAGTYNFTVTNAVGCPSTASASATINTQPVTPAVPTIGNITQTTCASATGSIELTGLPAGTWTINPGAISGSGVTYTVTGLVAGTYNFTVTNSDGCTSVASASATINTQPVTPVAPTIGTITQTTCASATGSIELTGLPAGSWTINPGAIAGSGATYTVTGLTAGTYNFTVTNAVGCPSTASASATINTQPVTPAAPTIGTITQTTCASATGSIELTGLPTGAWIINPGAIAGTGATYTVNGLAAGTYNFTVTNASSCTSVASASASINTQPFTPAVPTIGTITQTTCASATGSVQLTGLPAGTWTINPGAIAGTGLTYTISGLIAGSYSYSVTNSDGCTSVASASAIINTQPATPAAPTIGTITQTTCASATGSIELTGLPTGAWTINPGAIAGSGTTYTVTGLTAGTYNFTVTNAVGCPSTASASATINTQPVTPAAPTIGTITQTTCASATGSIELTGLPTGAWTINPGAIAGSGLTYTISGLIAGSYSYTVTNSDGCTSVASASAIINTQPVTPVAPTIGTITQTTCASATGSIELTGLPTGAWTINPGAIAGTGATYTVTGLTAGTYNFTVTNAVGCPSTASASATINTQPVTPAAPTIGTITQTTCASATGSIELTGLPTGAWTINPGAIAGTGLTYTISGLIAGSYSYTVTNSDGCTSVASASAIINTQPVTPVAPTIGTITQTTCASATGSIELTGLPTGTWTINPGTITGSGTTYTVNGLAAGTYNFTVTNSDGCTSVASASATINTQPVTPAAPTIGTIIQTTCASATGSIELTGLPTGAWIINPGAIAGTGLTYTISGLIAGSYSYTVTNSDGCTSVASASASINTQPVTPAAPTIGTITQTTCASATGSIELTGLPTGAWTINPGAIAGSGLTYTISGLIAGSYSYTVTNSDGCTSVASASATINTQPVTPAAPTIGTITQTTCASATGSIELTGLPTGAWTINPGAIAGSGTTYTVTGLTAGTYNFTVTNAVGCPSTASASATINTQPVTPAAPTIGTITQTTCASATGSIELTGLPTGAWTINPGAIAGSGLTYTISGLIAGSYSYTVTNSDGCTSVASASAIINTQPVTPVAPTIGTITQTTCASATGSIELTGLPTGAWTINPGTITGSGTTYTVNGLAAGTYNFTVTNSDGCTSVASASATINTQPVTPAAPTIGTIIQTTCASATGSIELTGLPTGAWTINPGAIAGTGLTYTISGLIAGSYSYTVTNSDGCTSVASASASINTQPVTPAAPTIGTITQTTCASATGSIELTGLPTGAWTINPGAIAGTGLTYTISGLIAGSYSYTVTNSDGCTSVASASAIINTQPVTPAAPTIGTITQTTCASATGSIELTGLPTGAWTINPGAIAGTGATYTVTGLTAGTYNFTVTNAVGCPSTASASATINTQPVTPAAPTIGTITQTTCASATGSIELTGLPTGAWTINPGAIAGTGLTYTISGLIAGSYIYTVTNSDGCTSVASASAIINTQPVTPVAPTIGTITQTTCASATGSIELTGLPTGAWIINPGAIAGTGLTYTISGLIAGSYSYTVTNSDGCTSVASASASINTQPATPAAPVSTGPIIECEKLPLQTLDARNAITNIAGINYTWYDAAGSTVLNPTLSSPGTAIYYVEANNGFCTSNSRTQVTLQIINAPSAPIFGNDTTECAQSPIQTLTAMAVMPPGQVVRWYDAPTVGNLVTNPTLNSIGTVTYFAEAFDGTCSSTTRLPVTLTIKPTPPTPISSGNITECQESPIQTLDARNAITSTPGPGVNYIWYDSTGLIVTNPTLSSSGTVTYYVEAVEGTCPSLTRTAVTLTIEQAPAAPVWIGDITECAQSTVQTITAVATVPAGQTITWFASNFGGFPIANPILNSVGTITYFAEANRGSCKSLSRTPVTLTINQSPAAPLSGGDITQCANSPIQTLTPSATPANAGDTIAWYDNLTGGAPIINPQWNTVGMKTFYAESNNGLCPSLTRTPVTLTLNAKPSAPSVIITQPDCTTSTGSFTVFPVAPGVTYSYDGGPFTSTTFYDLIADNSTHTLVAQNISNCTSSVTNIVIQQQPATPNAPVVTVTQPSCTVATGTIDITPVAGETYSFDNGPYVSTINYPNLFDGSTHTIRAKNAAGCFSSITTVLLDVQPTTPSAPVLTATQPSCSVSTGSISVAGNIGETYSIDGGPFTSNLTYPNLAAGSTHNVRAQNAAGCISVASSFTLDPQPPTPGTPVYTVTPPTCTDDFASVDITPVPGELYSFDGGPFTTILNYPNLASASTHTIVAQNSFGCESVAAVININPQPITPLPILYDGVICVDEITGVPYKIYILDTQLNLATHTFVWYLDGNVLPDTGNAIQATQPGLYGVIATNINGCSSALVTAQISSSSPGLSFDTIVNNQFSNDTSVVITVNAGTGPFLYQMDFGPWQESNIYTQVSPGTHQIKVTDAAGCTDLSDEILILGYPNFFTPNGDGFNDTWNIVGLKDQPDAEIYIFDRHGKFIKQISSTTQGWDGTMNGQPLPSTDYWFRAEYIEKGQRKEFKSHFSLVR